MIIDLLFGLILCAGICVVVDLYFALCSYTEDNLKFYDKLHQDLNTISKRLPR